MLEIIKDTNNSSYFTLVFRNIFITISSGNCNITPSNFQSVLDILEPNILPGKHISSLVMKAERIHIQKFISYLSFSFNNYLGVFSV